VFRPSAGSEGSDHSGFAEAPTQGRGTSPGHVRLRPWLPVRLIVLVAPPAKTNLRAPTIQVYHEQ
jgi:hypothetical protein